MKPTLARKTPNPKVERPRARPRTLASIVRVLRRALPALSEKYHIKSFGIFGSYARGEQKATSDLDVLVEYRKSPSLAAWLDLEQELSALVGTDVEVHDLENLRTYIRKNVMPQVIWLQKDGAPEIVRLTRRAHNGKHNGGTMQPKREYLDFLQDIVESMELAQEYVSGMTLEQMTADRKTRDSVERTLERTGEAAKRIPPDIQKMYPKVPWSGIIGMRNVIIHRYDGLEYQIIWDTIHQSIPKYLPLVRDMLNAEMKRRGINDAEKTEPAD